MKNSLTLALVAAFAFGCAGTGQGGDAANSSTSASKTAAATSTPATAAESKTTAKAGDCQPPPKDLVVKDLQEGTGKVVQFRSAVLVGYTGWTYDGCKPDFKGAEFDSSKNRPTPFGLVVGAGRVIKGWDEGLIGMKETKRYGRSLFGGGVSYEGGKLYATSGLGTVAQLDAATGQVGWQVTPGGPLRGAPSII